jgi:adenylate cyclase class 2
MRFLHLEDFRGVPMLEIEMKFGVVDFAAVVAKMRQWQARADEPIEEADHYFNAPDRDFGRTDEAYRLRRIGAANVITYKGPKQAGPTKTRIEIEVPLAPGDEAAADYCRLVTNLGYRPVAVVRKQRRVYHFEREGFALQVCLDEVAQVGTFVEVEIVAPEARKQEADKLLLQVAADLKLKDLERRSYLEMLLANVGRLS